MGKLVISLDSISWQRVVVLVTLLFLLSFSLAGCNTGKTEKNSAEIKSKENKVKEIVVPDDYKKIAKAVQEANKGDKIVLEAGTYYSKTLEINKNLKIEGAGAGKTTLKTTSNYGPVLTISSHSKIKVELGSLTISGNSNGIKIKIKAMTNISNCVISGQGGNGIVLTESSQAHISETKIKKKDTAIDLKGSSEVEVTNSVILENDWGISLSGSSKAIVSDTEFEKNSKGIYLADSSHAEVRASKLLGGRFEGVSVNDSAWVSLSDTKINGYGLEGIKLSSERENLQANLQDCTISSNSQQGVSILTPGRVNIVGSNIDNNKKSGIEIKYSGHLKINESVISQNQGGGIRLDGSSVAEVNNSEISSNTGAGIFVDSTSEVLLVNNTITGNRNGGIYSEGYGISIWLDNCYANTVHKFKGKVQGNKNEINGNSKSGICPSKLTFLLSKQGGCYGTKCS